MLKLPYTANSRLKIRYLTIQLFQEGESRTKIANTLNVSRRLVNEWVSIYLNQGITGLKMGKPSGRPARLSDKQKQKLKCFVLENNVKPNGGRLIATDIQRYIKDEFLVEYRLANIYRLLSELSLRWITSRSKHPKQSLEAQEAFKKTRI